MAETGGPVGCRGLWGGNALYKLGEDGMTGSGTPDYEMEAEPVAVESAAFAGDSGL